MLAQQDRFTTKSALGFTSLDEHGRVAAKGTQTDPVDYDGRPSKILRRSTHRSVYNPLSRQSSAATATKPPTNIPTKCRNMRNDYDLVKKFVTKLIKTARRYSGAMDISNLVIFYELYT